MHLNTNNNGQKLVDFAAARNMLVSSTCYPHKEIHPDILDIEMAAQFMNNNKSPGIGNNHAELYKKGGGLFLTKIHILIKEIWKEGKMPTD